METSQMILFVLISAIAVSYGWGMRGTVIGGEKGAMLPGAIMGLLIAVFSGSAVLRQNFYMLSAVGSMGMYFGGAMTYGETLGLSMNSKPAENLKKGLIGLFVKGGIWFGIFGSCMGIYLTASIGKLYTFVPFLFLFLLLPFFGLGFYFLFNKPHNAKKGKFPKIYFSKTRQECWGGLLGILLLLVIFMWIHRDEFALKLTLGSAISGAVGWVVAQCLQILAKYPMKNGKYFFAAFQKRAMLDAWKIMECTLGAIGGIGISLTICLMRDEMSFISLALSTNGGVWNPLEEQSMMFVIIWLVMIALDMLQFVIKPHLSRTELNERLEKKLLGQKKYDRLTIKATDEKPSKFFFYYKKLVEGFEFPLYCVIPLFFVLTGNMAIAKFASFFILFLVMVQEIVFTEFNELRSRKLLQFLTMGSCAALILAQFVFDWTPGIKLTFLMYGVYYEFMTLLEIYARSKSKGSKEHVREERLGLIKIYGSSIPTQAYFCVMIAIFELYVFFCMN